MSINLTEEYSINHMKSSPHYPQKIGQAEATNKTLLRILSKMVYEEPKLWTDFLSLVLWAYYTSKRTATLATPFSLVYGAKAVVLVKIMVPSVRLALTSKTADSQDRISHITALDERRSKAESRWQSYPKLASRAYNKLVRPQTFSVGDLVLRVAGHIRRGMNASKFTARRGLTLFLRLMIVAIS